MGLQPPVPYQWSVGDVESAALLNAQLYNGLTFLENQPLMFVYPTASQSISTGTGFTALTWPAPQYDPYSGYSSGQPTRYTPQVAGWYLITGAASFAANATGGRGLNLYKNGTGTLVAQAIFGNAGSGYPTTIPIDTVVFFNGSTDYLEMYVSQNSGGSLSTATGGIFMSALWVHS